MGTGFIRYFDPLPSPMDPSHHVDSILRMTTFLHDTYRPDAPPNRFVVQDPASYNHQEDGISCGFFVSLYVELYLQRCDTGMLLVDDGFLPDYRRRVVAIMSDLYNGNFPDYGQLPGLSPKAGEKGSESDASIEEEDSEYGIDDEHNKMMVFLDVPISPQNYLLGCIVRANRHWHH